MLRYFAGLFSRVIGGDEGRSDSEEGNGAVEAESRAEAGIARAGEGSLGRPLDICTTGSARPSGDARKRRERVASDGKSPASLPTPPKSPIHTITSGKFAVQEKFLDESSENQDRKQPASVNAGRGATKSSKDAGGRSPEKKPTESAKRNIRGTLKIPRVGKKSSHKRKYSELKKRDVLYNALQPLRRGALKSPRSSKYYRNLESIASRRLQTFR